MDIEKEIAITKQCYIEGNFQQAANHLVQILQVYPNNFDFLKFLGVIYHQLKQYDLALNYIYKALSLNPTDPETYNILGNICKDKGVLDYAKQCFRRAIQLDPNFLPPYYCLGTIAYMNGQRFATEHLYTRNKIWRPSTFSILTVFVDNEKQLLYLEIPKAGITTIKYELFLKPLLGDDMPLAVYEKLHEILRFRQTRTLEPFKDYFKFTVLRDPYKRFLSAYFWGIHKKYRSYPPLCKSLGIDDWPDEILNDPNKFLHHINKEILNRDRHTCLQSLLLPKDLNELDYIGRLEDMVDVERTLSQVLYKKIKFDNLNVGEVKNYSPVKVDVDRFNQIFAEDYEALKDFYNPLKQ